MGLDRFVTELLLAEHRYRPIRGSLLSISRQTIGLTTDEALALLRETGTPVRPEARSEAGRKTQHQFGMQNLISDESFYSLFTDAQLVVLDVSDYEQADIIHDMSHPVGPELENRFDFAMVGSCLDNIFDPVTALRNVARMVRPGGRIFLFEWGNSHPTAYLKFSPDWFHDYFAVNRFADCKAYVLCFPRADGRGQPTGPGSFADLYLYDPLVVNHGSVGYQCSHPLSLCYMFNIVVAEKGPDSTWDASPIQVHYRTDERQKAVYVDSAMRFARSPRPPFRGAEKVQGDPLLSRFGTLKPVASWESPQFLRAEAAA